MPAQRSASIGASRAGSIVTWQDLQAAAMAFHAWMTEAALPFWCTVGYGGPRAGFIEHLDPNARPIVTDRRSTLIQARQVSVYAHAATLGWRQGLPVAEEALRFLLRHAWRGEGGWARVLRHDGEVLDSTLELYDNAFLLLALAWFARAAGDAEPLAWAHRTLDAIEAQLRRGDTPGFLNSTPDRPGPRLQNPHMHLLEAALALHDVSGDARFAELARSLVRLFTERLFDPATGTLAEFYGPAWQRLPEPYPGRQIWPGHQFEWTWLLYQARPRTGFDAREQAKALVAFAERHGFDAASGLVRYAVSEEGAPIDPSLRLWPQAEALKAELALVEHEGRSPAGAVHILRNLLSLHLARTPRGTWTERYEAAGRPVAGRIPAEMLYHLFVAYAELMRVAARTP